jgi:hypothetical protein
MAAKTRMSGQEGMRAGGEGLIKKQQTALNEVRSGLVDDLIL